MEIGYSRIILQMPDSHLQPFSHKFNALPTELPRLQQRTIIASLNKIFTRELKFTISRYRSVLMSDWQKIKDIGEKNDGVCLVFSPISYDHRPQQIKSLITYLTNLLSVSCCYLATYPQCISLGTFPKCIGRNRIPVTQLVEHCWACDWKVEVICHLKDH